MRDPLQHLFDSVIKIRKYGMKYSGSIALVYIVKNLVSGFTGHEGRVTGGVYEVILARLYYRVKATHQPTHPLQYTEELQSRELEKS